MKKKSFWALLAAFGVAAAGIGMAACNESEHNYSEDWSNDEVNHWHVCVDDGCTKTDGNAAHTFGAPVVSRAATCYAEGEQTLACTVCDYVKTESIAKVAHSWAKEWSSDATNHYHVCTNDGCTETTAADEHGAWKDGDVIKQPSCTEAGVKNVICEVCDYIATAPIPAVEHTFGEMTVKRAATCTENGEQIKTCAVCREEYGDVEVIHAVGHTPGDWTQTKAPTCVEEGEESTTCAVCAEPMTRSVSVTGHLAETWVQTKAPTCTEDGIETATCDVCGRKDATRPVPAIGHNWGQWEIVGSKLCTEDGMRERHCTRDGCEATVSEEVKATEHRYGDWDVSKAPTCTEDGTRTHTCVVCEHEETETIPQTGHKYTKWFITAYPTDEQAGTAIKYCEGDHAHDVQITLPVLSATQEGYVYDEDTGLYSCRVSHSLGELTFKTYNIKDVADAVQVSVDTQLQVIRSVAVRSNTMRSGKGETANSTITCELGADYIHIEDPSENREHFYTFNADGSIFAVLKSYIGDSEVVSELISKDLNAKPESKNGYGYGFTFMMGGTVRYGVGGIIEYLYGLGKLNENKDFVENTEYKDNKIVYSFSYGKYDAQSNYFNKVSVQFSFDNNFIVSDAVLSVKTYVAKVNAPSSKIQLDDPRLTVGDDGHYYYDGRLLITGASQTENPDGTVTHNYTYPVAQDGYIEADSYVDEDGTPRLRVDLNETFEKLDNGTYRVRPGMEEDWANDETYTVTQTSQLGDGETLPTNPYKYEDFVVSSFDIQYGSNVLESNDDFVMNANESVVFSITNVLPTTYNPYFDEFRIYLIDEDGNRIDGANINQLNDGEIGYYFYSGNTGITVTNDYKLTVRSLIAGEWDLVIATENKEITLHLVVNAIAPNPLYAEIYEYNDVTEKENWNRTLTSTDAYQGETVMFRGAVDHPAYENANYTVTVTKDGADVTQSCITVTPVDGLPLYKFSAQETGAYTVTLASVLGGSVRFTVKVAPAPDVSTMLVGEFGNDGKGYRVTIEPVDDGELNGTATIVKGFDDNTETTVISYSYNEQTREFTCAYVSGAEGDYVQGVEMPYNYGLELSDAYKLYLTYESGFDGTRVRVLIGGFKNSLVCTDSILIDRSKNDNNKLVVNVSGVYRITSTGEYTFIAVNGGDNTLLSGLGDITLYVGDYIQLWNGMNDGVIKYSIELVEALQTVKVEGISFEQATAEVRTGATLALNVVFTPANTTQTGLKWSSSDAAVATVDERGTVTGVGAGTATIIATTLNGKYSATIEVTVIDANILNLGENVLLFAGPCWNEKYKFAGEVGKTYIVKGTSSGIMGGNLTYNGAAYNYPASFEISGGTVEIIMSQYSYGEVTVTITIEEKAISSEPTPNYDVFEPGAMTLALTPGRTFYYTIAGKANCGYTITISDSYSQICKVVDGNPSYDAGNYANGTLNVTTDENGFLDFCFSAGNGPGDYTVTVTEIA